MRPTIGDEPRHKHSKADTKTRGGLVPRGMVLDVFDRWLTQSLTRAASSLITTGLEGLRVGFL